jgi:hypothetical protein
LGLVSEHPNGHFPRRATFGDLSLLRNNCYQQRLPAIATTIHATTTPANKSWKRTCKQERNPWECFRIDETASWKHVFTMMFHNSILILVVSNLFCTASNNPPKSIIHGPRNNDNDT